MSGSRYRAVKAYENEQFLHSPDARSLRILAEYLEPASRFREFDVQDTIVMFGSARICSREEAETKLAAARAAGVQEDLQRAELGLEMSHYSTGLCTIIMTGIIATK